MKRLFAAALAVLCIMLVFGCENKNDKLFGSYIYEKEGFGGSFVISLGDDGKFAYYEGMLSSYYGRGEWTYEDGKVTLVDDKESDYGRKNVFAYENGTLTYIAMESDGFLYVDVADGEEFVLSEVETVK